MLPRRRPSDVALAALRHAALVDHRHASQGELQRQRQLQVLDGDPSVFVVDVEAEGDEPLVSGTCVSRLELFASVVLSRL